MFMTRAQTNVNGLEFLSAIIMLAKFDSFEGFEVNSQTIDHKLNLLLVLYDFREDGKMNLSEILIMVQNALDAVLKVFPESTILQRFS